MPRRAEGLLLATGWGFVQATYRERFPKSSLSCSFPSWDLAGSSGQRSESRSTRGFCPVKAAGTCQEPQGHLTSVQAEQMAEMSLYGGGWEGTWWPHVSLGQQLSPL